MNNINVLIDGIDYSNYVVSPLKMGNLLDEQLDEVNLTLRYTPKAYFEPQTLVKIEIKNVPEAKYSAGMAADILDNSDYNFSNGASDDGHLKQSYSNGKITQTFTKYFIVASDNAAEIVAGSGRFEHEIYLIERTKILEGFISDSLTFTNPTAKNFSKLQSVPIYIKGSNGGVALSDQTYDSNFFKNPREQIILQGVRNLYLDACEAYSTEAPGLKTNYEPAQRIDTGIIADVLKKPVLQQVIVYKNGKEFYLQEIYFTQESSSTSLGYKLIRRTVLNGTETIEKFDAITGDSNYTILNIEQTTLQGISGDYSVKYKWILADKDYTTIYDTSTSYMTVDTVLSIVKGTNPPKKLTISDTIDRIFDTLEPTRAANRFSFDTTQKAKYDKILAPEFTFTKMNVREMLRTIGGFIHAEPRLKDDTNSNVVIFDEYGSNEKSHIAEKDYISYQLKSNINEWCTALDSSAENLVNQLDYAQGVSYEPARRTSPSATYGYADITLRTENVTARFSEDDSCFIPTSLPIYKLQQVKVVRFNNTNYDIDITPYIYEEADYGLLKSNNGYYPNAKAFAVYYRQGEKNIKGLFYKEENSISPYLNQFSIVNIIRAATSDYTINITGQDLYRIGFNIVYTPIYSTRIRTIKQTLTTGKLPRAIAYNQGANLIETRYYGENLKGVVARLGNVEKTYTYHLAYLSEIPKVGTLFDDNYYISSVYTEILQSVIKCTIGLSKDFNRLSQYVGISSNKRMWEVSEKQSQQRQSIYTEYMKVSMTDTAGSDTGVCFVQTNPFFTTSGNTVTFAAITTKTLNGTTLAAVLLPSVASAIGNSMIFTCSFEDNYSAGEKQSQEESGIYGQYVPYCDYFGKFYYMDLDFAPAITATSNWNGTTLPERADGVSYYPSVSIRNWKYRKDNREIPQITYELSAVSDDEEIIIGSALMQNNYLVNNSPLQLVLYGFTKRLNKINSEVDLTSAQVISTNVVFQDNGTGWKVTLPLTESAENYVAFAIVTQPSEKVIEVTDDNGNDTTQTIKSGGLLYIGINKEYNRIKDNPNIYLSIRKEI